MKELLFVTTNPAKVIRPREVLAGYGILLSQLPVRDVPEVQADRSTEVALAKARWVWRRYGAVAPILVADSSFHISALSNWPGAYVKWATRDLGLDGYLRLMSPWPEPERRTCYFLDSLVCVYGSEPSEYRSFRRMVFGRLASKADDYANTAKATSELWRLFIPHGYDKTLAAMDDGELRAFRSAGSTSDVYHDLADWINST